MFNFFGIEFGVDKGEFVVFVPLGHGAFFDIEFWGEGPDFLSSGCAIFVLDGLLFGSVITKQTLTHEDESKNVAEGDFLFFLGNCELGDHLHENGIVDEHAFLFVGLRNGCFPVAKEIGRAMASFPNGCRDIDAFEAKSGFGLVGFGKLLHFFGSEFDKSSVVGFAGLELLV